MFQSNARTTTPNTSAKRRSKLQVASSSVDSDDVKVKPKKSRSNSSAGNTDILTNLGLTNNHVSPLRKNNTLLDRPEVKQPVNINKRFYKIWQYIFMIKL